MPSKTVLELAWERYLVSLRRHPLKTKAITSSIVTGIADVVAQRLASSGGASKTIYNWRRTVAMALFGLIWAGPSNHFWQQWLERFVKKEQETSGGLMRVLKKVAMDQLVYGPIANLVFMILTSKVIEGKTWNATADKIRINFASVQRKGWTVWPAAQVISHAYVPLELRVLWANIVAFCWSTYLILQSRGKGTRKA